MVRKCVESDGERYPGKDKVLEIVKEVESHYPDDCHGATMAAIRRVERLKEFPELVDFFVYRAVQRMVHEIRHTYNTKMKKEAGEYGKPGKVNVGKSKTVQAMYEKSAYMYRIDGRTIGSLLGEELIPLAIKQEMMGRGGIANAMLRNLKKRNQVPDGTLVRVALPEHKVGKMIAKSQSDSKIMELKM